MLVSSVIIGAAGVAATFVYNNHELEIKHAEKETEERRLLEQSKISNQIETNKRLEALFKYISSEKDSEREFGYAMFQALGEEGLAVKIIALRKDAAGAAVAERATASTNPEVAKQAKAISPDLMIGNQVAKGFEQLGSDKLVVRLGGIYALEGAMNTSEQYHRPVLEALSAFVRDGTRTDNGDGPPATDIQAALTVIGRRAAIGTEIPNLANAHIPKANLTSAYLSGANLTSADLSGAGLGGANLTSAYLRGADLSRTFLGNADLSGTFLGNANLTGADLRGANLSGTFLGNANLTGADLTGAKDLTPEQLDQACGRDVKLDPGLTLKPCSK